MRYTIASLLIVLAILVLTARTDVPGSTWWGGSKNRFFIRWNQGAQLTLNNADQDKWVVTWNPLGFDHRSISLAIQHFKDRIPNVSPDTAETFSKIIEALESDRAARSSNR